MGHFERSACSKMHSVVPFVEAVAYVVLVVEKDCTLAEAAPLADSASQAW